MVRVAAFGVTEYLKSQCMQALIEERVACRQQHQVPSLAGHHETAFDRPSEDCFGLHCVQFGQHLHRMSKIVPRIRKEAGNLVQNPLNLPRLSGNGCRQPVVEFDNTEGLDERGGATSRNVEQESVELGARPRNGLADSSGRAALSAARRSRPPCSPCGGPRAPPKRPSEPARFLAADGRAREKRYRQPFHRA